MPRLRPVGARKCGKSRVSIPFEIGTTLAIPVRKRSQERGKGNFAMLYWAAVFFVIALAAAVLGFSGVAASAAGIAKILFFVFLVLGALSLIFGRRVPA
jgi:uncharacterized membrane protein YtjA (UPF0391 family)